MSVEKNFGIEKRNRCFSKRKEPNFFSWPQKKTEIWPRPKNRNFPDRLPKFLFSSDWVIGYDRKPRFMMLKTSLVVTSLLLASTKWVWSTFSSHCPLSSNRIGWLASSATLVIFTSENVLVTLVHFFIKRSVCPTALTLNKFQLARFENCKSSLFQKLRSNHKCMGFLILLA